MSSTKCRAHKEGFSRAGWWTFLKQDLFEIEQTLTKKKSVLLKNSPKNPEMSWACSGVSLPSDSEKCT